MFLVTGQRSDTPLKEKEKRQITEMATNGIFGAVFFALANCTWRSDLSMTPMYGRESMSAISVMVSNLQYLPVALGGGDSFFFFFI